MNIYIIMYCENGEDRERGKKKPYIIIVDYYIVYIYIYIVRGSRVYNIYYVCTRCVYIHTETPCVLPSASLSADHELSSRAFGVASPSPEDSYQAPPITWSLTRHPPGVGISHYNNIPMPYTAHVIISHVHNRYQVPPR